MGGDSDRFPACRGSRAGRSLATSALRLSGAANFSTAIAAFSAVKNRSGQRVLKSRKDFIDMSFPFGESHAAQTQESQLVPLYRSPPQILPTQTPQHMKSSQLHTISPILTAPPIRISKTFATLFAAALAMGLGAQSVLAQGAYYPQVAPLGGSPFIPNGFPVTSNSELNLIESNMSGTATLIIPAVLPKTAATLAEYKAAVQKAAMAVANGVGGSVTIASLSNEVARFRQASPSQVSDGLASIAAGIIASGSGAKLTLLQALALNAAKSDPAGATSGGTLAQVFAAAAADNTLVAGIGSLVSNALTGAGSANPPPAALSSVGVRAIVANAVSAISNATTANAATADNMAKGTLILALPTAIIPALSGSTANIDQASAALVALAVQPYAQPGLMVAAIKAAVVAPNDAKLGAIAQGALRTNPAAASAIDASLSTPYTTALVNAFVAFNAAGTNGGALAGTYDPVAVAAAGSTRFGGQAPQIVKDVLNSLNGQLLAPQDIQDLISRGVSAAIGTPAQNVATAAVGAGAATLFDVTTGATKGAPVGSAGAVAKAVVIAGGLTAANASTVGGAAISAAASVSPVSNKTDAYADIAYNLADALKGDNTRSGNAVTAEVQQIIIANGGEPTAPSYIAIVAAAAAAPANRAAIVTAGNTAAPSSTTATNAGVSLLNAFSNVPLANYQATLNSLAAPGSDARNLAVLYAASLGNPGDAAGSLAALIANTGTSAADLTAAAVSANRSKQTGLTIAATVASFAKANPTADIQATVGHQILDNPTYVKEISAAATVVLPQFSHNIAHTVAFDAPKAASDSVAGIFLHSQITVTGKLALGDRPAAGAAITAGLTTGILESTQLSAPDRKLALQGVVVEAVKALVNPLYNKTGPGNFVQSNGGVGTSTVVQAKGVAGGITGFVAQMVKTGDHTLPTNTDLLNALFQASYNAGVLTGTTYLYDIAQAAGQAFGWVSGAANAAAATTTANDIATAVYNGYPVLPLANIRNAVDFGFNQAAGGTGVAGVGAGGLRDLGANPAAPFYDHHSASGRPVSNIFSL